MSDTRELTAALLSAAARRVNERAMESAADWVKDFDPAKVQVFLAACIAISFTDGFLFGVEFVRAQRQHMAVTS